MNFTTQHNGRLLLDEAKELVSRGQVASVRLGIARARIEWERNANHVLSLSTAEAYRLADVEEAKCSNTTSA